MEAVTPLPHGPLRVDGVGIRLGGRQILSGISLALHPGELCALIGPSGAGKSTLIRVLLGLREPDEGDVSLRSAPIAALRSAGYVPQEDALHRNLTVEAELAYAAELRLPSQGVERRAARVVEVLAQVGLSDRAELRIRKLSGGQRKRVAVAIELLTSPPLLILDEPTSGLDPGLEARTMALLSEVAATGRIVLVATHAMGSLERADALCVLVGGHVAYFGPPRDALRYFRVDRYEALFHQLEKQSPSAWSLTARADADQRAFLLRTGPDARSSRAQAGHPADARGGDGDFDAELARLKAGLARGAGT